MNEDLKGWFQMGVTAVSLLLAGVGAYYKLESRVQLAEQRIDQETRGYGVILSEVRTRLDRLETKIDDLTSRLYERTEPAPRHR